MSSRCLFRRLPRVTDQLQGLAGELAADYVHGRWHPEATEDHRARILSAQASTDGGLDGLAAGGVLTAASINQMLRPHPELGSWRSRRTPAHHPHHPRLTPGWHTGRPVAACTRSGDIPAGGERPLYRGRLAAAPFVAGADPPCFSLRSGAGLLARVPLCRHERQAGLKDRAGVAPGR
jgi:hypothetical protein